MIVNLRNKFKKLIGFRAKRDLLQLHKWHVIAEEKDSSTLFIVCSFATRDMEFNEAMCILVLGMLNKAFENKTFEKDLYVLINGNSGLDLS